MTEDKVQIIEDGRQSGQGGSLPPWLLLVVDDDESVHRATKLALDDFTFEDRPVRVMGAFSAQEARDFMSAESDTALILLDVVMEQEHAGLDLVRWIRDDLQNSRVRIVLRTGQPGFAPELQVVRDYDINDYKEKHELTASKLITVTYAALRSFRDILKLEDQASELEAALQTAEFANRAKTNFINHMSHEFRTPLNGILGLSEMIASEMFGPIGNDRYKEYAWDIVDSGRRLLALIESVLELTEDGDGKPLELIEFDLKSLINDVFDDRVQQFSDTPRARSDRGKADVGQQLMLRADKHAVRTMLMNLISNALAHNPQKCRVRVTARQYRDSRLELAVVDDGVGIDQAVLKRLGEPFNFEGNALITGQRGFGLGLRTTKRLIERHRGTMQIDTQKDKGTTVRLVFPGGSVMKRKNK